MLLWITKDLAFETINIIKRGAALVINRATYFNRYPDLRYGEMKTMNKNRLCAVFA